MARRVGRPRKRSKSHKRHHKRKSGRSNSSFQNRVKYNMGSARRFPTIASRTQRANGFLSDVLGSFGL